MDEREADILETINRLDKLLETSYRDGYLTGAVAAATGEVVVEKRKSGYYLRGGKDASTDTATVG